MKNENAVTFLFENAHTWSKTASTATGSTAAIMLREKNEDNSSMIAGKHKGSCQKRFGGFRPLRGGGYPPFPLRKNSSFLPR